MVPPLQQGPSPFDGSSSSTHSGRVLQTNIQEISHAIFPEEQPSQTIIPFCPSNHFNQALLCLITGIGVELWCMEIAWPGICEELFWFDCAYPNSFNEATSAAIHAMVFGPRSSSRKFDCPVFVAEARNGWPRTCNNVKSANMADLRRHLTTRAGRGYTRQLAFLELCPTCNNDFIDKDVFEFHHGYRGELCNNRQPQRRGANAQVQWELLYRKVEAALASEHAQTLQNDEDAALRGSSANLAAPSTSHDAVDVPTSQPVLRNQDVAIPYLTPYQLIFESDSEEEKPDQVPPHTAPSVSRELNQSLSDHGPSKSDGFLLIPRGQSDTRDNTTKSSIIKAPNGVGIRGPEPTTPAITSRHVRMVTPPTAWGATRGMAQLIATSQSSIFGGSSEATSPRSLDTTPSLLHTSIGGYSSSYDEQSMKFYRRKETRLDDAESERWPDFLGDSTRSYDEDLVNHMGLWGFSSCSDASISRRSRRAEPVETSEPRGSSLPRDSQGLRPMSFIRIPDPPNLYSTAHSLPSQESDSEPHEYFCSQCSHVFTGRYARGNLARHQRHKHQGTTRTYPCDGCHRVFNRKDARLKHYRKHHPELLPALSDSGTLSARPSKPDRGKSVVVIPGRNSV